MIKNKVGRPAENKPDADIAKGRNISLSDNESKYLVNKFGGLTKAIKTLLPKKAKK